MLNNKSFSFPFFTTIFLAIGFLYLNYYTLNKGLVMDDEGWYLYLLKEKPSGLATQFYQFIPRIFHGDIYSLRLFNFCFQLVAIFIYSAGLYLFLKGKFNLSKRHVILFFSFTLIGFSLFTLPVCNTPYYVSLNRDITLIGIGITLTALKTIRANYSSILFVLGGFVSGFLFFVMITTSPIFLLYIILIYTYSASEKRMTHIGLYIMGILLCFVYYFTMIESLPVFFKNSILPYASNTISAKRDENHGLIPMARWLTMTLKYLLFNGFLSALIIVGYNRIKPILSSGQYYILAFLSTLAAFFFYHEHVIHGEHAFANTSPFLGLFIFFIVDQSIIHKNLKYTEVFLTSILFVPVLLSFGSDVDFKTRLGAYAGFMFPLLYIICAKLYSKRFMHVFMIVIVFYAVNIFSMISRNNWGYFNYSKQTVAVGSIGIDQHLKIDSLHFNNIKALQTVLNSHDTVILSNKRLWGYSYLLNLKPLTYQFRATEENHLRSLKKHENIQQLKLFETVYAPFDKKTIERIKQTGSFYCTDTAFVMGIYYVYTLSRMPAMP